MYKTNYKLSSLCHPQPCLFFCLFTQSLSLLLVPSLILSQTCTKEKALCRSYISATNYINIIMNRRNLRSMSLLINRSRNKDALNAPLDHVASAAKRPRIAILCIFLSYRLISSFISFLLSSSLLHYRLSLIKESRLLFITAIHGEVDDEVAS